MYQLHTRNVNTMYWKHIQKSEKGKRVKSWLDREEREDKREEKRK